MDLSVMTITWNSAKYITDQMRSVSLRCTGLDWEQIIVDNASTDGTPGMIGRGQRVKFFQNKTNLGFAGAYNNIISEASGRYFLFLNPDMEILDDLAPIVKYLDDHPDVGVAGCRLTDKSGAIDTRATPRRLPRWRDAAALFFKFSHLYPTALDHYLYREINWERVGEPTEVESVRGSCLFVRRELIERLGHAFDPRYYLWWEDVDLCRSALRLGYRVVWHPGARVADSVGRSFARRHLFWKQWTFFSSMLKYFLKRGV